METSLLVLVRLERFESQTMRVVVVGREGEGAARTARFDGMAVTREPCHALLRKSKVKSTGMTSETKELATKV